MLPARETPGCQGSETNPSVQTPQKGRGAGGASSRDRRGRERWKGICREGHSRGGGPWGMRKVPAPCPLLWWQALSPACPPRSRSPRPGAEHPAPAHASHPVVAPGPLIRSLGDASPPRSAPDNSSSSRCRRCFPPHTPGNSCLPRNSNKYLFPQGGMGGKGGSRPHAPGRGERAQGDGHNARLEKFPVPREVGWCRGSPPDPQPRGSPR